MKRILCLWMCLLLFVGMMPAAAVQAEEEAAPSYGNLVDDCADFSVAMAHSEDLRTEVTAEENRYAFDDYTMIMRSTATAQWLEYEIPSGQYLIFHTYFRQGEAISHFTFSWSADGENWQEAKPEIQTVTVDSWKWIPVIYRLKHLDAAAKYVKITFGNIDGTEWSPSLAGVYSMYLKEALYGFADCADTPYAEATAQLQCLGFVSGYTKQEYRPYAEITRAEFAQLIARAICANGGRTRVFADVSKDDDGASAIAGLYGLGILSGEENGLFHPDDPITYIEAAKIITTALGYQSMAEQKGGYPVGYAYMARQIGVWTEDIPAEDELLNRGDAAVLLSRMLQSEMLRPIGYGASDSRYVQDGSTPLSYYHHIDQIKGQLTHLGARSIGDTNLYAEDRAVIGNTSFAVAFGGMKDLLGMDVTAYVKTEENAEIGTILYAAALGDSHSVLYTAAEYRGLENQRLIFQKDGRETSYPYNENTRVIYNGRYDSRMGMTEDITLKSGTVRLVFRDGSRRADAVLFEEYTPYEMAASGYLSGTLSERYTGAVRLGLDQAHAISITMYGERKDSADEVAVEVGDTVFAAKSKDGYVLDIYVLNNAREGILQTVHQGESTLVLQGEALPFAPYLKDAISGLLGKTVRAVLDPQGMIVAMEEKTNGSGYGYLQAVTLQNGVSPKVCMRMVTQSGQVEEYTADSSTRLNESKAAVAALAQLRPQLVRYIADANQKLLKLETAQENRTIGQNGFALHYTSDNAKYYGDQLKVFASVYQIDDSTKIFLIPEETDQIEKYEVGTAASLITDHSYRVALYDVDDSYHCGAAVVDLGGSERRELENSDPIAVICEVEHILDKDQNSCLKILAKVGGEDAYIYFDTEGGKDVTGSWVPRYQSRVTAGGQNPFYPGEVMQYYMDAKSHCRYFRMLLTRDMIQNETEYEKNMGDYGALGEQSYFSEVYTVYGTVRERFSDKLLVTNAANHYVRTIPLREAKIYRYKMRNAELLNGDQTDLAVGSRVFVRMNYTAVREIVVMTDVL